LSLFTVCDVEITTDGETLEDGEVNEDATPKGLLYSNHLFLNVGAICEKLIDVLVKQITAYYITTTSLIGRIEA